jgi:ribonuclease J
MLSRISLLSDKKKNMEMKSDAQRNPGRGRQRRGASRQQHGQRHHAHVPGRAYHAPQVVQPSGGGGERLKVIPLGGLSEFGRNMMLLEYGKDMIIIDMGLMFPLQGMPGIDFVLPKIDYVKQYREKLRGMFITHGHLDHTGAIPYYIKDLGFPTIYGTQLTIGMIRDRLEEFNLLRHTNLTVINADDILQMGVFKVSFFRVNHNIPDSVGVAVQTPVGTVVHTGDWKFDHTPQDQLPTEFWKLAKLGGDGVLLLCSDSTNSERPGFCQSEKEIESNIEQLFRKADGRIIVATFASLVSRVQQIINAAAALNRKVAISGMSMEKTFATAVEFGNLKVPRGVVIKIDQIKNYPENRLVIVSTGSQGQETSALGRMSRGEHRHVKIQKGDTVILSSSPIPGNERAVMNLMNNLYSLGANVIYNKMFDVHTSGHAYREEMKLMLGLVRPKYFLPIHGERFMLVHHAEIAYQMGWNEKNVFVLDNGQVMEFTGAGQGRVLPTKLDCDYVMVDGLGVGDVGNVVLRDRQVLAEDGMMVIIATIDKEGALVSSPDIISRGFIYVKGAERLMNDVRMLVRKLIGEHNTADIANWTPVRNKIRDDVGQMLFQKTEKRPMVLPVIIRV